MSSVKPVSSPEPVSPVSPVSSGSGAPESSPGGSPESSPGSSVSPSVGTQSPSAASVPGPHSRPVVTSLVSASHANSVEAMSEREMVRVIESPPRGADEARTVAWLAASKEALDAIFPLVTAGLQFGFVICGDAHLEITQASSAQTVVRGLALELLPSAGETQRSSGRSSCCWSCGVCWRDV